MVAKWAPSLQHAVFAWRNLNFFEKTPKQLVPDSEKLELVHECTQEEDLFFLPAVALAWLVVCVESLHAKTFSRIALAATEVSTLGAIMVSRMSRIFAGFV